MKSPIFIVSSLVILSACGSSPEKAIVNRWTITDVLGSGHDQFLLQTAKAKEKGEAIKSHDMEFTKEGKCNMYSEDGMLERQSDYILAPDGKSVLIKEPNGSQSNSVKILELSSSKLTIVRGWDTLVFKPK